MTKKTQRFWLVGVVSVLMAASFASATVIHLDMNTTPTANGFTATGNNIQEDITTNPGELTVNSSGGYCYFNKNITDGLGTGAVVSFGATITFDNWDGAIDDRYFQWNYKNLETGEVYAATMKMGLVGLYTRVYFGGVAGSLLAYTTVTDGQPHTFRIDVDVATGMGSFYFDGVDQGLNGSVISTSSPNVYSYISWGDQNSSATEGHAERWDNVFFSNEVPEPATLSLLSIGALMFFRKRREA